jgi:hypothetical protein
MGFSFGIQVSLLTDKERKAFADLNSMLNNARSLSGSEWIPINGTGSQRLADYTYSLGQLQKLFFDSVVSRFPEYTDFQFIQNCTDIVARTKSPSLISRNHVLLVLRQLKRRNGSECVFLIDSICRYTGGSETDVRNVLDDLEKYGEVLKVGIAYRLNCL